jgi:hypothetical protein
MEMGSISLNDRLQVIQSFSGSPALSTVPSGIISNLFYELIPHERATYTFSSNFVLDVRGNLIDVQEGVCVIWMII